MKPSDRQCKLQTALVIVQTTLVIVQTAVLIVQTTVLSEVWSACRWILVDR